MNVRGQELMPLPTPQTCLIEERMTDIYEPVRTNSGKASTQQQHHYNLRRREWKPSVNSWVYKREFPLSTARKHFSAKLAPKYSSPHTVVKRLSPVTYQLRGKEGRRNKLYTAHIKNLEPCNDAITNSRPEDSATTSPQLGIMEGTARQRIRSMSLAPQPIRGPTPNDPTARKWPKMERPPTIRREPPLQPPSGSSPTLPAEGSTSPPDDRLALAKENHPPTRTHTPIATSSRGTSSNEASQISAPKTQATRIQTLVATSFREASNPRDQRAPEPNTQPCGTRRAIPVSLAGIGLPANTVSQRKRPGGSRSDQPKPATRPLPHQTSGARESAHVHSSRAKTTQATQTGRVKKKARLTHRIRTKDGRRRRLPILLRNQ